jgi:hypothetical protein
MPLLEVVSSEKLPPEQIGATCAKLGVRFGLTTTVIVALVCALPGAWSEGISGCLRIIYRGRPGPGDAIVRSGLAT